MVRGSFVANRGVRHYDLANRYFRIEHAGAAACDELAGAARDYPIEHRGGHRRTGARMHDCEPLAVDLELINRMASDFADGVIDLAGAAVEDEIVDHVLKEAEHAMLRYIDRFVDAARLDDGAGRRIVFEDWKGRRGQALGGARGRFAAAGFHPFLLHSE